jgi:hypothetical protein
MAVGAKILVVALGANIFGALRLDAVATEKTVTMGIDFFRFGCVKIETIVALAAPSRIQVRLVTGDTVGMPQMLLFFKIKIRPVSGAFVAIITFGAVGFSVGHVGKAKVPVLGRLCRTGCNRIAMAGGTTLLLVHIVAVSALGLGWNGPSRILRVEKSDVTIFAAKTLFRVQMVRKNDRVRLFYRCYRAGNSDAEQQQ